jgi:hypothetical protein
MDVIKLFWYAYFPKSFERVFGKVESIMQNDYCDYIMEDRK